MPNVIKTKKKRASTLSLIKNMKTIMTLSDRLKLAGIREFKQLSDVKAGGNLKKNSKKRKKTFRTTREKLRNLPKDFFTKNSDKNQTLKTKKDALERSLGFPTDSNSNIKKNAEKTLSVSLDFIKDCQMYRKKVVKPKEEYQLSNPKKKTSAYSFDCKQYHFDVEKSENSLKENKTEDASMKKSLLFHENNREKLDVKEIVGDGLKDSLEEIVKTFQKIEPLINKLSISDFAKIDKKYLESVLSLANNPEPNANKNSEKGEVEKEKTKPLTGKTFCHGESKNKELGMGNSKTEDKSKKLQKTSRYSTQQSQKDQISSRVVRDSTKSEVQLQVRKNIGGQRNSEEIKIEKEEVHSKSELSEGRKKRKHRNNILKNNKTDLIEIPFSSEVSKAKDVKELWRRETKKKSEISLTSHSSCTIPDSDENPKWKNLGLQSYRILHKLVEEEINKISKKSENKKKNIKEVKNQENNTQKVQDIKTGNIRERIKSKNILNKVKFPADENLVEERETLFAKKKLTLAENLQKYSTYEGEKSKAELLSILDDNLVKPTKKLPEDTEKKCAKVSDQTIQNWSIINRLEQAFLALGSSNFQNEKLKTKQLTKNNPAQNYELVQEASKESEKQKKSKPQTQTTHGTLSSRKTFRSIPKARQSNNESTPTKKKREDVKLSSIAESKEKKQNEPRSTEPSNVSNQNRNAQDFLSRKKTYIITLKDASDNQIQKSDGLNKAHNFKYDKTKKNITETKKCEPKNQEKDVAKDRQSFPNRSIQNPEEKTKLTTPKNQTKPIAYERTSLYHKNFKFKSGIPKPKIRQKQRREKAKVLEELLQHQMNEKKELSQRNSSERPVKQRSILSMHGSQQESQPSMEKFQPIQEKASINFAPTLKSSIGDLLLRNAQKNFENLCQNSITGEENINSDILCTDKTELTDQGAGPKLNHLDSAEKISQTIIINTPKLNLYDSKGEFISTSSLSQQQLCKTKSVVSKNSQNLDNSRNLFLWEKDIRRYREIVKDIMSQYKRIDGFLKQSERLGISSKKSVRNVSSKKNMNDEQQSKLNTRSPDISLQEYRKKIINEYQTLPFFEYKQFKKDENIQLEEAKKRHLSVVSDINKEMDFDVKDYQPNIKKVLDSQLYVDKEIVFKQTIPDDKFKSKKLSLQEMMLSRDRDGLKENCMKSYSLPKTFLLYGGEFRNVQRNNQRQKC